MGVVRKGELKGGPGRLLLFVRSPTFDPAIPTKHQLASISGASHRCYTGCWQACSVQVDVMLVSPSRVLSLTTETLT